MSDTSVAQIFVNFSKRKITVMDDEGYEKEVQWKWDKEGSEGFAETVDTINLQLTPTSLLIVLL